MSQLRQQLIMVVATMFEMLILAMSMSIFTTSSWYSVMIPGHGMAVHAGYGERRLSAAFHQQQLAAGILWICGDFWAVPILVIDRATARRVATARSSRRWSVRRRDCRAWPD